MSDYARLIEIFGRLVAYQTVYGDKHVAYECLQYIERALTIARLEPTRYSSNGFESLVATTSGTKKPKLFLQSHIDVVPGNSELFELKRQGKRLVGRGAYDMKYAAACFLLLVEELGASIKDYDFGLMFTSDEEGNGINGTKYLLGQGYSCDVCFLPDGGDNWRIESAAKGGAAFRATATGKSAHSSRPWEGDNAIDKIMGYIAEVKSFLPSQDHTGTTVVVSQISGGETHNQVPGVATATFDLRFLDQSDGDKAKKYISDLAAASDIKLEWITNMEPVHLDLTLPALAEWENIVTSVRGEASEGYALSFGASDARYFAEKHIPCIVTRPGGGGHHSSYEWIEESGLYDFYECIKRYVVETTGVTT